MTLAQEPGIAPGPLGAVIVGHVLLLAVALLWQLSVNSPQLQAPLVVRLVSSDQARQKTAIAVQQVHPLRAPLINTTGDAERLAHAPEQKPIPDVQPKPTAKQHAKTEQDSSAPPAPAAITEPKFEAAYLNNPAPEYPPLSRKLREEGRVLLRVVVSPEGTSQSVEINTSSGFDRLDNAARRAVTDWHFVPAQQFGRAVTASVLVPVIFSIRD